jgi:hypothetical protein
MGKDPSFPFYASDWLGSNVRDGLDGRREKC